MFLIDFIWLFGFYIFPVTVKRIILLYRKIARWWWPCLSHAKNNNNQNKTKELNEGERETERKPTKKKKTTKMDWELWSIRNAHFFCVQMKTNQLFRFRNLLLLVFISRMNIWLWKSVIKYTHAHGNLNSNKQPSQTFREAAFMLTNIFSVYVCVVRVRERLSFFFLFYFLY